MKYSVHKNADIDSDAQETFLTFKQWKAFYYGDPENWHIKKGTIYSYFWSMDFGYWMPYYKQKENGETTKTIFVKFLTAGDYRLFIDFVKDTYAKGEDYENLKEIEDLAHHISKITEQRLIETQQRTQQAIEETKELMEKTKLQLGGELNEFSL